MEANKMVLEFGNTHVEATIDKVDTNTQTSNAGTGGMGSQVSSEQYSTSNSMNYSDFDKQYPPQRYAPAGGPGIGNQYPRTVTAVRKDQQGNIVLFKLDDGRVLDYSGCADAIHRGELNLICTTGKSGTLSIRSYPDGDPTNNLDALPTF